MLYSYLVATGVMATLMTVWVLVQSARRRMFADATPVEDLLSGCVGCGTCLRNGHCEEES